MNEGWAVLTNVSNDIEYEIIAGLLHTGNIPTIKQYKGLDGYLVIFTGTPIINGIDVLVPEDKLEEARMIIDAPIQDDPEGDRE